MSGLKSPKLAQKGRWNRAAALVAVASVAMCVVVSGGSIASANGDGHGGKPDHVFYIMMENHGFSQIIGNTTDAPFANQLASRYGLATNFHGVTHPSLPNYLAAFSGDFQGIWDDCKAGPTVTCPPEEFVPSSGDATTSASLTPAQTASATSTPHWFSGPNLVDQLEHAGRSWKAYMQSLPSTGSNVEYAPVIGGTTVKLYAQKHNPFMYFSDIGSNPARLQNIVPFEHNFAADLAAGTVPDFAWISPDQCHDMHGVSPSSAALVGLPACGYPDSGLDHGAIQLGDQFLQQTVSAITSSSTWKHSHSTIVISWDENDYSGYSGGPKSPIGANGVVLGGGDAPLLVVSSQSEHHKVYDQLLDHYSVLRAIEQRWHLGCLANTCHLREDQILPGLSNN